MAVSIHHKRSKWVLSVALSLQLGSVGILGACSGPSASEDAALPTVNVVEYEGGESIDSLATYIARQPGAPNVPVVYFYANWCGPCKRFKESMHDGRVAKALKDATIIKINVDTHEELAAAFGVNAIPAFIKLNNKGKVLGRISSDKWEEDVPENIAPVMEKFVHSTTFDGKN